MKLAVTGGRGFLGWHSLCRLKALHGVEPILLSREDLLDDVRLAAKLTGVDAVLHLAGVNRAESDDEVEAGNVSLAEQLARGIRTAGRSIDLAYSNTVQATLDNSYGRGKAAAARVLGDAIRDGGGNFANVLLPNLFGEHGRPGYNSFVATFAHEVASGRTPIVTNDRQIPLMHAQEAADVMIRSLGHDTEVVPVAEPRGIGEVLDLLQHAHSLYAKRGEIPPLRNAFETNLFNTYRSAAFPGMWPLAPAVHSDSRGDLFETVRVHGGTGQAYISTTRPGQIRGEHYHLHKVERFFVVKGEAEIQLRRLCTSERATFRLSGERPSFVDMPTLWVHNIRNVGAGELITMFWSDQLLDPQNPDQFPEKVGNA